MRRFVPVRDTDEKNVHYVYQLHTDPVANTSAVMNSAADLPPMASIAYSAASTALYLHVSISDSAR